MATSFCRILKKYMHSMFFKFSEVDLKSRINWTVLLSAIEKLLACPDGKYAADNSSQQFFMLPCSTKNRTVECCEEQELIASINMEFESCQSLLKFLCWMPKGFLKNKSLSIYVTCILNIERFVVAGLRDCHVDPHLDNWSQLFHLFVLCRKALKHLLVASFVEKTDLSRHSLSDMLCESSLPVLWLLKSLFTVIRLQHAALEGAVMIKDVTALLDHTSYVFLTLSKNQSVYGIHSLVDSRKPSEEVPNSSVSSAQISLNSVKGSDAWKGVVLLAETLREQVQNKLNSLKISIDKGKVEVFKGIQEIRNLTCIISCFQGFLWGFSSALEHIGPKGCNPLKKLANCNFEPVCKVNLCIDAFSDFINNYLLLLFLEDDEVAQNLPDSQMLSTLEDNEVLLGLEKFPCEDPSCVFGILNAEEQKNYETEKNCSISLDTKDDAHRNARKKRSRSEKEYVNNILNRIDISERYHLKESLLLGFLRGEKLEAAFFLRQLFIASAAILRLTLQINCNSLPLRLVPILISISDILLLEFSNKIEVCDPFSFFWLDGVVKFFEQLGSHFPLSKPSLSCKIYSKLIDLHLRAIGKCISLQGRDATLASHETWFSSSQVLGVHMGSSAYALSSVPYCLDELKARLRMSFKVFIQEASELHLLSVVQAIERAVVGVKEICTTNYEISMESENIGKVSSIVAGGVDCFDLVLEFVKGRTRLNVVKRHIQSIVSCLFNIIVHAKGPGIFSRNVVSNGGDANSHPDQGSVVLMCVEVLTIVSAKHALFQMHSCHVGQSLHLPAALFQHFLQLNNSILPRDPSSSSVSKLDPLVSHSCIVDRQFSVRLYAACCRLLCTILKHRKSECQKFFAQLENSVSVLLYCLEMVADNFVSKDGNFGWEVQEGVRCASLLRRIYEEIKQQRDVFGQHSFLLLSNYVWVYCGFGPFKNGIVREIDEALKPGVYALLDACSADDLQHLHTVFGEGPCRSTLAALQHDYKQNFQYEGKV